MANVIGSRTSGEVGGRGDEQLERAVPALALDRAAGGRARRRPDPHHRRRRGRVERATRAAPGAEHEERDRREEERPSDAEQAVERRARHHLQVEEASRSRAPARLVISLGDERDVGVLERGLARGDATDGDAVELGEQRVRQLASPAAWTTSTCACSRSSTETARDARRARAARSTVASSTPNTSISTTRPLGDARLQVARRALGDDLALRDHGDPVAERVGLEHVVGRQQHGLAGR